MKRPAHGAFSGKSDSSGSSFAKLCGGGFRVRSGISSQKIRTFFKKIKNFQKKITAFLKKNKSFFKNVLIFLPLPEIPGTLRSHSIEVQTEGGNLAASKIRNLECPSYEICLIDYGCGKFNRKIHIMEQYP